MPEREGGILSRRPGVPARVIVSNDDGGSIRQQGGHYNPSRFDPSPREPTEIGEIPSGQPPIGSEEGRNNSLAI